MIQCESVTIRSILCGIEPKCLVSHVWDRPRRPRVLRYTRLDDSPHPLAEYTSPRS